MTAAQVSSHAWEAEVERAAALLAASRYAIVLTGAGHSTPSGIPDFRSPGSGLWEKVDPAMVASIEGFQRDPQAFYDWVRPLARQMREAKPNAAHVTLVELERAGVVKAICTQNIDELHQRAGSSHVWELHGTLRHATCTLCGHGVAGEEVWPGVIERGEVPHCPRCHGVVKPDVVLYGELLPLDVLRAAQDEAIRCDVMLVAGSSLEVYPAAGLPQIAWQNGARLLIINYEPTLQDEHASVVIHADVSEVLPRIARRIHELKGEHQSPERT